MPRQHSSSSSSGSSYNSAKTAGTARTSQTDDTEYSDVEAHSKGPNVHSISPGEQRTAKNAVISPRASSETYASTIDIRERDNGSAAGPEPPFRFQCYEPDTIPATSKEFAAIYPSTRRLMIQHDETTEDGNMNLHIDTEVTTSSGRRKKLTLFHLRMKDLKERQFSLRRYCRDSGREVSSCKRHYIKSAPSTPPTPLPSKSVHASKLSHALNDISRKQSLTGSDSGYSSGGACDDDDEEDELDEVLMQERLNLMTTPPDEIIARPTESIKVEFSNYSQLLMDRRRKGHHREYQFEYWGNDYSWKREKHVDDGETIYSYELMRNLDGQKMAIIMPDALSPQEAKWEAKQGGWVPASSMRLLRTDISDDLGDVIMATGLTALTDDSIRRHFHDTERRR